MDMHHLFVCKEEAGLCKAIKPTGGPTIVDAPVPGYISKKKRVPVGKGVKVSKVQKVLSEEARVNADAAVKWALRLHSNGRSLNGKFQASDLTLDQLDNVKCEATKRALLKKATPKRKTKDFKKIGKIIKYDILGVQSVDDVPSDVTLLLDLLKTYTVGSEILIANHPGLKTKKRADPVRRTEDEKISAFNRMFQEMEHLLVTDPPKYHRIIAAMPYGQGSWKAPVRCNTHVNIIYTFQNRTKNYKDSSEGALVLHRNCFQHLIRDHSTQTIGGVTVVLFVFKQMEHMMGTILPGFIANLMVQLNKESVLQDIFP